MVPILFIHILLSEVMILKSSGKAVIVIAEEFHERGFDFRSLLIDLGIIGILARDGGECNPAL